jgi:hypothetical protein
MKTPAKPSLIEQKLEDGQCPNRHIRTPGT